MTKAEKEIAIDNLTQMMNMASAMLDFERAIKLRDEIKKIKESK